LEDRLIPRTVISRGTLIASNEVTEDLLWPLMTS